MKKTSKFIAMTVMLILFGTFSGTQSANAIITNCYSFSRYIATCYSSGYSSYYPSYSYSRPIYIAPIYDYSAAYNTLLKAKLLEIQIKYDIAKLDRERQQEAERQAHKALEARYDRAKLTFTAVFKEVNAKDPTGDDQDYWINRILNSSLNDSALREKMKYYKSIGKTRPDHLPSPQVAGAKMGALAPKINSIFRSVYDGRNPTPAENTYWVSRIKDKRSEQAMKDAMFFHKANKIKH